MGRQNDTVYHALKHDEKTTFNQNTVSYQRLDNSENVGNENW